MTNPKTPRERARETVDSDIFPHLNDENRYQAIMLIESAITEAVREAVKPFIYVMKRYQDRLEYSWESEFAEVFADYQATWEKQ